MVRKSLKTGLSAVAVTALAAAILAGRGCAAESPFVGTWKVVWFNGDQQEELLLVQIEDRSGQLETKVLSTVDDLRKVKLEDLQADTHSLHCTLQAPDVELALAAYPPRGESKPAKIRGSLRLRARYFPLIMEQTEAKKLIPDQATRPIDGREALQNLDKLKGEAEVVAALKNILDKYGTEPVAYLSAQVLLQIQARAAAPTAELRSLSERFLQIAGVYGLELESQALLQAASLVARSANGAPVAVELARQADQALGVNAPPEKTVAVLKILITALRATGQVEEVKRVEARRATLEEQLDQKFLKQAIPFQPRPVVRRQGAGTRVAVVELFTGAQCPPCIAADIAFGAALQAYKPDDVVLLQYHLHVPGPDPLTNPDSEARALYYSDHMRGTPAMFVDGQATPPLGGFTEDGEANFNILRELLNRRLEIPAGAKLTLRADRTGDQVNLHAEVADLKKTGAKVRLRFVLIEDMVRYAGSNGRRLHHHVVRAFPGGVEGFALKDKTAQQDVSVDLGQLTRSLRDYLAKPTDRGPYLDDDRPLDLKHLKAVALIQDDESKEILQAVQVEAPEAK
jgi:hypothetical protein